MDDCYWRRGAAVTKDEESAYIHKGGLEFFWKLAVFNVKRASVNKSYCMRLILQVSVTSL